ncbi:mucin-19-like isoform X2 [Eriocheir sinensis]|uniref:mucin-19-like isoform X2 n=1 Tax=Eriocheir sinensis TaxID=95602 RepID=UPI0021C7C6A1|nr:mucin-19-like isoform X2 [Eriocheir sinensis]
MLSMCGLLCSVLRGWRHNQAVILMARALSQTNSSILVQDLTAGSGSGTGQGGAVSAFCVAEGERGLSQLLWCDNNKQAIIVSPRQCVDLQRWTLFLSTGTPNRPHRPGSNGTTTAGRAEEDGVGVGEGAAATITVLLEATYRERDEEVQPEYHVMVEQLSQPYAWKARDVFGVIVTTTPPQLLAMIQAFFNNALHIDDDFLIKKIITIEVVGEPASLADPLSIPECSTPGHWSVGPGALTQLELARSLSPSGAQGSVGGGPRTPGNSLCPPALWGLLRHQSSGESATSTSTTLHPQSSTDSERHQSSLDPQSSYDSVSDYLTSDTDDLACNVSGLYPRGWAVSGAHVVSGQPLSVRAALSQLQQPGQSCSIVTNPLEDLWQQEEGKAGRAADDGCVGRQSVACLNGPSSGSGQVRSKTLPRVKKSCGHPHTCLPGSVICQGMGIQPPHPGKKERDLVREAAQYYQRALDAAQVRREGPTRDPSSASDDDFSFNGSRDEAVVTQEPLRYPVRIRSEADLTRATSIIRDNLANIIQNYLFKPAMSPESQPLVSRLALEQPTIKLLGTEGAAEARLSTSGSSESKEGSSPPPLVLAGVGQAKPLSLAPLHKPTLQHQPAPKARASSPVSVQLACLPSPYQKPEAVTELPHVTKKEKKPFTKSSGRASARGDKRLTKTEEIVLPPFIRGSHIDVPITAEEDLVTRSSSSSATSNHPESFPHHELINTTTTSSDSRDENTHDAAMRKQVKGVGKAQEILVTSAPGVRLVPRPQDSDTSSETDTISSTDTAVDKRPDITAMDAAFRADLEAGKSPAPLLAALASISHGQTTDPKINGIPDIAMIPPTPDTDTDSGAGTVMTSVTLDTDTDSTPGTVMTSVSVDTDRSPTPSDRETAAPTPDTKKMQEDTEGTPMQTSRDMLDADKSSGPTGQDKTEAPDGIMAAPGLGKQGEVCTRVVAPGEKGEGAAREGARSPGAVVTIVHDGCISPIMENNGLSWNGSSPASEGQAEACQRPRCLKDTHKLNTKSSTASESSFESLPYRMLTSQPESLTDDLAAAIAIELTRPPPETERLRAARLELIRQERIHAISLMSTVTTDSEEGQAWATALEQQLPATSPTVENGAQETWESPMVDSGVELGGLQEACVEYSSKPQQPCSPTSPMESAPESGFSSLRETVPEGSGRGGRGGVCLSKSKDSLDLTDADRCPGTDTLSDDMETLSSSAGEATLMESGPVSRRASPRNSVGDSQSGGGSPKELESSGGGQLAEEKASRCLSDDSSEYRMKTSESLSSEDTVVSRPSLDDHGPKHESQGSLEDLLETPEGGAGQPPQALAPAREEELEKGILEALNGYGSVEDRWEPHYTWPPGPSFMSQSLHLSIADKLRLLSESEEEAHIRTQARGIRTKRAMSATATATTLGQAARASQAHTHLRVEADGIPPPGPRPSTTRGSMAQARQTKPHGRRRSDQLSPTAATTHTTGPAHCQPTEKTHSSAPVHGQATEKTHSSAPVHSQSTEKTPSSAPAHGQATEKTHSSAPAHGQATEKTHSSAPAHGQATEKTHSSAPAHGQATKKTHSSAPAHGQATKKTHSSAPAHGQSNGTKTHSTAPTHGQSTSSKTHSIAHDPAQPTTAMAHSSTPDPVPSTAAETTSSTPDPDPSTVKTFTSAPSTAAETISSTPDPDPSTAAETISSTPDPTPSTAKTYTNAPSTAVKTISSTLSSTPVTSKALSGDPSPTPATPIPDQSSIKTHSPTPAPDFPSTTKPPVDTPTLGQTTQAKVTNTTPVSDQPMATKVVILDQPVPKKVIISALPSSQPATARVGNTVSSSDQPTTVRVGNTVSASDQPTTARVGNTVSASDQSTATRVGNTVSTSDLPTTAKVIISTLPTPQTTTTKAIITPPSPQPTPGKPHTTPPAITQSSPDTCIPHQDQTPTAKTYTSGGHSTPSTIAKTDSNGHVPPPPPPIIASSNSSYTSGTISTNDAHSSTTTNSSRPSRHSSKSGVSDLEDEVFLPPPENLILNGHTVIYCPRVDMASQMATVSPKAAMAFYGAGVGGFGESVHPSPSPLPHIFLPAQHITPPTPPSSSVAPSPAVITTSSSSSSSPSVTAGSSSSFSEGATAPVTAPTPTPTTTPPAPPSRKQQPNNRQTVVVECGDALPPKDIPPATHFPPTPTSASPPLLHHHQMSTATTVTTTTTTTIATEAHITTDVKSGKLVRPSKASHATRNEKNKEVQDIESPTIVTDSLEGADGKPRLQRTPHLDRVDTSASPTTNRSPTPPVHFPLLGSKSESTCLAQKTSPPQLPPKRNGRFEIVNRTLQDTAARPAMASAEDLGQTPKVSDKAKWGRGLRDGRRGGSEEAPAKTHSPNLRKYGSEELSRATPDSQGSSTSKSYLDADLSSVGSFQGAGGSLELLEGCQKGRWSPHTRASVTTAHSQELTRCEQVSLKSEGSLDKFPHFDQVSASQRPGVPRRKGVSVDDSGSGHGGEHMHRSLTLPGSFSSPRKDEKKRDKEEKGKKKKKEKEAVAGGEKKSAMMSLKGLLRRKSKEKEKESTSQEKLSSPSLFRRLERRSKSGSPSPLSDSRHPRQGNNSPSSSPVDPALRSPVVANGKTRPVISSPVALQQAAPLTAAPASTTTTTATPASAPPATAAPSRGSGVSCSDSESAPSSTPASPQRRVSLARCGGLAGQPSPRLYKHVLTRNLSSSQESLDSSILSSAQSSPQSSPHGSPQRCVIPQSASSLSLPAGREHSPPAPVMGTRALRGSSSSFSVTIGFRPRVERRRGQRTVSEGADLNRVSLSPGPRRGTGEGSRVLTQLGKRSSSMEILVCGKIREHCPEPGGSPGGPPGGPRMPFSREGSFRLHREISVETLFEVPEGARAGGSSEDYRRYLDRVQAARHGSSSSLVEEPRPAPEATPRHRPRKYSVPQGMHLSGMREAAMSNPNLQRAGSPLVRGMTHSSTFSASPLRRPTSATPAFSPAKRSLSSAGGGSQGNELGGGGGGGVPLMRVDEEGPARKNLDASTDKPPNILVYAANNAEYYVKVQQTIALCVNPDRYIIYHLTDELAFKSPWSGSTTLLVVCGDVPAHISTVFIRYLLKGGRVLSVCSDFLNMAVPLFAFELPWTSSLVASGTVEVQEQAVVSVSYQRWSSVHLLHHQHCFHSSPRNKRFSRINDTPPLPDKDPAATTRSAVSVEPTHVEIIDEYGGLHRLDLRVLAKDDTWGAPTLLAAKVHGGQGIGVFSQVHLEHDPQSSLPVASEASSQLAGSNTSRLEILRELLASELNLDTSLHPLVTYTPAYFLGRHQLKEELLSQLRPHLVGEELQRSHLSIQFVMPGCVPKRPAENLLPILTSACPLTFSTVKYFETLNTTSIGRLVIYCDVVSSSMRVVAGNPPLVHGLVVIPTQQTHGQGRSGNMWLSPLGCAMFSIQLHLSLSSQLGQHLSFLQHLVAMAVVQAVVTLPGYADIPLRLKWPNDIYLGSDVKIGGVVVEATTLGPQVIVNIGSGINLSNSNPTGCLNDAIRQHNQEHNTCLEELEREVFLARVFNALESLIHTFQNRGPGAVQHLYYRHWLHSNAVVTVQSEHRHTQSAVVIGIDSYGFLQARLATGETITLQPDGNSFNMMEGLVYSKVK